MAESHAKHHDYHIIDPSPWPALASLGAFITALGAIAWMRALNNSEFSLFGLTLSNLNWGLFAVGMLGGCVLRSKACARREKLEAKCAV